MQTALDGVLALIAYEAAASAARLGAACKRLTSGLPPGELSACLPGACLPLREVGEVGGGQAFQGHPGQPAQLVNRGLQRGGGDLRAPCPVGQESQNQRIASRVTQGLSA